MSKIEQFWQDATADDVARVMKGETVEARFRDDEKAEWFISELAGWTAGMIQWYSTDDDFWAHCQVYREPSWYADKPDPGPGFRLLGKFPDEPKLATDEAWDCHSKEWHEPCNNGIQQDRVWYRRRIEVEPEPRHYVLRVGDSVETPSGHRVQVISRSETQRFWSLNASDKLTLPNGQTITITEKGFEVTQ